jgi:hypothetical protein
MMRNTTNEEAEQKRQEFTAPIYDRLIKAGTNYKNKNVE